MDTNSRKMAHSDSNIKLMPSDFNIRLTEQSNKKKAGGISPRAENWATNDR